MTRPRYFHVSTAPGSSYAMRADTRKALAAHLLTVGADMGKPAPSDVLDLADKAWRQRSAYSSERLLIGAAYLTVENASKADFEAESEYYVNHVSAGRIAYAVN